MTWLLNWRFDLESLVFEISPESLVFLNTYPSLVLQNQGFWFRLMLYSANSWETKSVETKRRISVKHCDRVVVPNLKGGYGWAEEMRLSTHSLEKKQITDTSLRTVLGFGQKKLVLLLPQKCPSMEKGEKEIFCGHFFNKCQHFLISVKWLLTTHKV